MSNKIILASDEPIVCPKCSHKFPLHLGITQQTIEKYESEYEAVFAAERKVLEERLAKEGKRRSSAQARSGFSTTSGRGTRT